jgi:hypothetical protein
VQPIERTLIPELKQKLAEAQRTAKELMQAVADAAPRHAKLFRLTDAVEVQLIKVMFELLKEEARHA